MRVGQGEFVAIIGKYGSGKSSLLHCLLGELNPRPGASVSVKGKLAYVVLSGMTIGRSPNRLVSPPFKADGTAIRGSNAAPNAVDMVNAWYRSFEGE